MSTNHIPHDENIPIQGRFKLLRDSNNVTHSHPAVVENNHTTNSHIGNNENHRDSVEDTRVEDDPWNTPDLVDDSPKWSELDSKKKCLRIFTAIGKVILLTCFFYLFVCSLDFLSSAFRLIGGKGAGKAISQSEMVSNPVAGLMIGVLFTVLVQSSSTSTSIMVSMVASKIISVKATIPLVMGANIGTSITNTIVSLAQAGDRNEFRRAFAAATILDMFNWLTVLILLPLEAASGYLYRLTGAIMDGISGNTKFDRIELLQVITRPFTDLIVESRCKKLDRASSNIKEVDYLDNSSQLLEAHNLSIRECSINTQPDVNLTSTEQEILGNLTKDWKKCNHVFANTSLNDTLIGVILLVISLVVLCFCLISIVKILHTVMKGNTAKIIKKMVNAKLPSPFGFLTGYLAILVGTALTFLVQSSSIFTSTLTPLVGVGVISLKRMYPLTLGANIGTTFTAVMAAMTSSGESLKLALRIAFCHLFFNVSGIIIWYPIPYLRKIPIGLSKTLGNTTAKYRWFAIVYLITMFLLLPGLVFVVSLGGWPAWVGVFGPIGLLLIIVIIMNILQKKLPSYLPEKLRTWDFLPLWMHSLEPYDRPMTALGRWFGKLKRCSFSKEKNKTLTPQTNFAMKNSMESIQ
ncbi:sodium-dependent phosphate transport protein 2B [Octopus bimaculoides]|uniref:sodium-dependent phosphate transport protein 2B n=1 Tax=Octopus bimaculoides TaxID=37653 RepID=UPI0022E0354B|nr:sodium-dependent phosphate transport protein 2B [Octopus bimaculoides]